MEKFFVEGAEEFVPTKNTSPYKRILAIGDVHGQLWRLTELWEKISVTAEDLVIFLGDYMIGNTNKTDNLGTLEWLLEKTQQENIIALLGNTDYEILKMIEKRDLKTPPEILNFLKNLPHSCEMTIGGNEYFFCHCGVDPDKPLDSQSKSQLIGLADHEKFYREYNGAARIIVGHRSPNKISKEFNPHKPLKVPNKNILMLDTCGKKKDGKISCVDILSGQYWQSDD